MKSKKHILRRWVDDYFADNLSKSKQDLLDAFIAHEYNSVSKKIPEHLNAQEISKRIWKQVHHKTKPTLFRIIYRKSISIAAACLLVGGLIVSGYYGYQHRTIETRTGSKIDSLSLPDGSKIYLAANTTFKYPVNFSKNYRTVVLKSGAAFFKIKPNKHKPFIVNANGITTTVLGTSFYIDSKAENTTVVVKTGKVSVKNKTQELILIPFEKAISKSQLFYKAKDNSSGFYTWFDPLVSFKNTSLNEVVEFLSIKYQLGYSFLDKDLKNNKITFQIKQEESLTTILENLKFITQLNFKLNNNHVEILKP